jgi:hypothetical protein
MLAPAPYPRLPRLGSDVPEPCLAALLWDLVTALLHGDRAAGEACLLRLGADPRAWKPTQTPWWLGAGSFVLGGLSALKLDSQLPAAVRDGFLADSVACRARHAAAVEATRALVGWLEAEGIRPVVMKGVGFAAWIYPEPWMRPCGDIDLLVRPADHAAAIAVLVARGCASRPVPGETPSADVALRLTVRGHPFPVELHEELHQLGAGPRLSAEAILAGRITLPVGGRPLPVPAEAHRVAHLLIHHPGELDFRHVLDMVLAARAVGPAGLRRARRDLPAPHRWLADLVAGVAADLGGLECDRAVPRGRRFLIRRLCVPRWGRAFVLRASGRIVIAAQSSSVAEAVRCPLALTGHRLEQQAMLFGQWAWRLAGTVPSRALASIVLARDIARFVFPPWREFARRSGRVAFPAYLANSLLAAKSVASQVRTALRSGD